MVAIAGVLILALAAAARLYQLDHPFWLDELHTSWTVCGGCDEVSARARDGNQPPLYFWLTWLVSDGSGGNEWRLRMPSLLASLLVLPAAGWLLWRLTGRFMAGLVAGYLLAINPMQIAYAQEARAYAIIELVSLLHVGLFVLRTSDARWWRRALLVLLTVLLFYLHYTAVLVLTGELAWYVLARRWRVPGTARRQGKCDARADGAAGVRAAERVKRSAAVPTVYTPWALTMDLAVALACMSPGWANLFDIYGRRDAWRQIIGKVRWSQLFTQFDWLSTVGAAAVASAAVVLIHRMRPPGRKPALNTLRQPLLSTGAWAGLLACWFLVPLLLVWTATALGLLPLMLPRYLLFISVVPAIAAGWLVSLPRRPILRAAAALAVCLWITLHTSWPYGYLREDWAAAIRWMEDHRPGDSHSAAATGAPPDDVQLAAAGNREPVPVLLWAALVEGGDRQRLACDARFRDYLLFPLTAYYRFQSPRPLEPLLNASPDSLAPGHLLDGQVALVRRHGAAWIVYRAWRRDVAPNAEAIRQQLAAPGETWHIELQPIGPLVVARLEKQ